MDEPIDIRRKRLHMRSIRRGIKEMDLILGDYASRHLPEMEGAALDAYEALLDENDQDLYAWVSGRDAAPAAHADLVAQIAGQASGLTAPRQADDRPDPALP